MTPAERLLAAADLLEKRAGEATKGPWETYRVQGPSGNEVWGVTSPEPNDEGDRTAVAMVEAYHPTYEPTGGCWDQADATYIATMHPEVGRALASTLRDGAALLTTDPVWCGTHLLTLADLLLAGAS